LTLSPSILGPVILDLCFSKGVCSSITTARDRDRLDQKQPPRETLTSTDDNPNCDLAKTTIDLLSVPHTFNPLSSPLVAKTNTDPLSVSHTLSPFSSPPVSAKEHVSVTPNSAKTIKLEHHYFSLYLTQITDFTEPPNIRPRRRYDSNLAHLAPLKHGFLDSDNLTKILTPENQRPLKALLSLCRIRKWPCLLRPALPNLIQLEKNLLSKNRFESDNFCSNYGFIDLTNIGPRLIYIYSCDLHSAPPKHGILILNG